MSANSRVPESASTRAETESFQARSLSASLTVKDLERSLAWYHQVVGFTVDRKHEGDGRLRAVSLRAGDVRILISQDDGAKGLDRVKGEGFSLQITTDQNVDEIAKRIKELGGKTRDGARRHALGRPHIPVEGPGRLQAHDVVRACGLTSA